MANRKVIIIGGVAGGASTATRLRRLDEHAEIIMLERGDYVSFANCGLPYYVGGVIKEHSALTVQTPDDFRAKFNIDVRIKNEVTSIDTSAKTVTVKDLEKSTTYSESYTHLVLAPGAAPVHPRLPGADSPSVFTLRNIPDMDKIVKFIEEKHPKSAVVMGGGAIGIEMAENLHERGLEITIAEMMNQLIAPIDYDMACTVHSYIESMGIHLALGKGVSAIDDNNGKLQVKLTDDSIIPTDMLIMSIGVRPETMLAKEAGIALNEKGAVITDEHMKTSAPDVYAVGDAVEVTDSVTGKKTYVALAGPANRQGRVAADAICETESAYPGTQGSSIIKVFDMTVASTGVNEKAAKRLGLDYDKVYTWSADHATYYPGAVNMAIKTVFEKKTGRILGAQVVGFDGVDKRCDVLATAIRAKMTGRDVAQLELCYAPPFGSAKDPVNMVGFVIENIMTGKVKQIHLDEVEKLPRDGSVQLIDDRDPEGYETGHLDGFKNIPLSQLRTRLGELDKNKKVYVCCKIGLTAYLGCRVLMQNGFDAYDVAGGYRLYSTIHSEKNPTGTTVASKISDTAARTTIASQHINLDACGLQCPGPIMKLSNALKTAKPGDVIEITASDPAFPGDAQSFCSRTGDTFISTESKKGISTTLIQKGQDSAPESGVKVVSSGNNKNIIVFSGDLDKAIASFIIANAAAAMGRKVSMFFTFWGLNILRKPNKVHVIKNFTAKMFSSMMPRGTKKLGLSRMNMAGMGPKMIRNVMKKKNVDSLEQMIQTAQQNGVELQACSMSMDLMGITKEELIDGVKCVGAASMLANAEQSDMSLFI
jgi:NADPH-dependent 2,4-dienoyl-CoA reductase/sulfur reductase-like enzyme/peroxiredoxin family protein/TusA-related sulfurtransferase/rhodanese-related sulfurtransferase